MLRKIALSFRNKSVKKEAKDRGTVSYQSAKKVGFLLDQGAYEKVYEKLCAIVTKDGKTFEAAVIINERPGIASFPPECLRVSMEQYSKTGKIIDSKLTKFIDTEFDFLFSIHQNDTPLFDNILASSNAKCRVGVSHGNDVENYELMIAGKPNESIDVLTQRMIHYSKNIK